jgi:hypothetical protein
MSALRNVAKTWESKSKKKGDYHKHFQLQGTNPSDSRPDGFGLTHLCICSTKYITLLIEGIAMCTKAHFPSSFSFHPTSFTVCVTHSVL